MEMESRSLNSIYGAGARRGHGSDLSDDTFEMPLEDLFKNFPFFESPSKYIPLERYKEQFAETKSSKS